MSTNSQGQSIRQKILDLSKKLGVRHANIETVFLIERMVARLVANKNLQRRLIFKGGFVGLKIYDSPRYTIDLDALLLKADIGQTLEDVKKQAETDLDDGVWFRFEDKIDLTTQGEYGGIRHVYRAGIGEVFKNVKKAQVINFDLGIGDPITPEPLKAATKSLLSNETLSWYVYPIETIIAEKLHALISHGDENSRSKDIYDLTIFLPKAHPNTLKEAIEKCFDYRKTDLPDSFCDQIKILNTDRLKRGWTSAISSISYSDSFDKTFSSLLQILGSLEKKWD